MTNNLDEMIAVVQAYILDKKGVKVKIVFNNMQRFADHFEMLRLAYHHVMNERKK
jgi:hypothetical protein